MSQCWPQRGDQHPARGEGRGHRGHPSSFQVWKGTPKDLRQETMEPVPPHKNQVQEVRGHSVLKGVPSLAPTPPSSQSPERGAGSCHRMLGTRGKVVTLTSSCGWYPG